MTFILIGIVACIHHLKNHYGFQIIIVVYTSREQIYFKFGSPDWLYTFLSTENKSVSPKS